MSICCVSIQAFVLLFLNSRSKLNNVKDREIQNINEIQTINFVTHRDEASELSFSYQMRH